MSCIPTAKNIARHDFFIAGIDDDMRIADCRTYPSSLSISAREDVIERDIFRNIFESKRDVAGSIYDFSRMITRIYGVMTTIYTVRAIE
ncbi:MAG: hypothetical protein EGQ34_01700 [Sutterella sp.]|nr:hypothetical protein [Sutterella sp.]